MNKTTRPEQQANEPAVYRKEKEKEVGVWNCGKPHTPHEIRNFVYAWITRASYGFDAANVGVVAE